MTNEILERAVNGIDDKFIAEARLNVKEGKKMNRKKVIVIAAVCAALVTLLAVFGTAKMKQYTAFSPEHREHIMEQAEKAVENGANDEEIAAIKAATGGFSDRYDVVLEDEPYMEISETVVNGGYVFELQDIRKGKGVYLRGNGQSPIAEAYELHEQVEEGLFAVIKVTREDGTAFVENGECDFTPGAVISGHQPFWSHMCMNRNIFNYYEDGAEYYAFDLTNGLIFADHDIYIVMHNLMQSEQVGENNEKYMLLTTKDGVVSFAEEYEYPHALFRIKLDDSLADKQAQKEFIKEHKGINKIG